MWLISLFFLSIMLLAFAWKCLRKSMLDTSRDYLFDLREDVRANFIKNSWGLDSIEYKRMRDLINCAIRYAEEKTLFRVIRTNRIISKNKVVSKSLKKWEKEVLSSSNPEIESYLKETFELVTIEVYFHLLISTFPVAVCIFAIGIIHKILRPVAIFKNTRPKPKKSQLDDFLAEASGQITPQVA